MSKGYLHSLPKANEERDEHDRYWTPCYVTEALLQREKFVGSVLEPANGNGHVSHVLRRHGYEVEVGDITTGQDFLLRDKAVDNIITNPPYGKVNEFLAHALRLATGKVAMMCRLHVVVSKGRFAILNEWPGIRLYIFTTPIHKPTKTGWEKGSAFTHCWLVVDKNANEKKFDWIQFDKHFPLDPSDYDRP